MIQQFSIGDASFVESLMNDNNALGLLNRVNDLIHRVYGDSAITVTMPELRAHAFNHPLISPEGEIVVAEDTQIVRVSDKFIPIPTLRQAIVIILALGIEGIRLNPASIKPHHVIEAMKLAKQLGFSLGQEELEEVLQRKISQPSIRDYSGPMAPPTSD